MSKYRKCSAFRKIQASSEKGIEAVNKKKPEAMEPEQLEQTNEQQSGTSTEQTGPAAGKRTMLRPGWLSLLQRSLDYYLNEMDLSKLNYAGSMKMITRPSLDSFSMSIKQLSYSSFYQFLWNCIEPHCSMMSQLM